MDREPERSRQSKVVLYTTADGHVMVDVSFEQDNFWLPQRAIAELFGVQVPAVSRHLKNIFESGELRRDSVVSISETTAADGKRYSTLPYNLSDCDEAFAKYLKGDEEL